MKNILTAALCTIALTGGVQAASVDLTDGVFTEVTGTIIPNDPLVFSETSDGVTFTFTALNNLVGITRFLTGGGTMSNGLQLGGGGGSTISWSVSVSENINLTSYSGFNSNFLVAPIVAASVGGNPISSGAAFSTTANTAGGAGTETIPSTFVPGSTVFQFDVTNASATTQGYLTGFTFDKITTSTPVPLPAGLPLLLAGLGAFGLVRRKT